MLKRSAAVILVLLWVALCAGQKPPDGNARADRQRAEAVARNMPARIKALDEPAMRAFLRLRAAKFLWAAGSESASGAAEALAADALADILEHEAEVTPLYVRLFRRELLASLQIRAPDLAVKLIKQYGLEGAARGFDTAYEMLGSRDGAVKAVEIMRRNVQGGTPVADSSLNFFLSRLDETQPAEVNRLLVDILNAAESAPGRYPLTYLFGIANKYLYREATPTDSKARFLGLLIRASANPAALPSGEQTIAYNLLRANMTAIERLLPALYAQAAAQVASLASVQPKQALAREGADDNVRRSADPVEQLITEAEGAKDESLRREFLSRAAQRALDGDRLALAVELIMKIKAGGEQDERFFIPYRDQFLGDVLRKALAKKDYEAAARAAANVQDRLLRAAAMQRIGLSYHEAGDVVRARELLQDASKLVESAEDSVRKAVSLLQLAALYPKVDDTRVLPTTQASVKIINSLPSPNEGAKPGTEAHREHVETLMQMAYVLIQAFQRLSQEDEAGTFALAERIQRPELRAAAVLGASMGVPTTVSASKTEASSKTN